MEKADRLKDRDVRKCIAREIKRELVRAEEAMEKLKTAIREAKRKVE